MYFMNNQIRTPQELFNYCSSNIHNIAFFYVEEDKFLTKEGTFRII
jgi:hypothetical protein